MELNDKSLDILELPAVLEMLAGEAVSDTAKEAARGLRPFADEHTVTSLIAETTAAVRMMTLKSSPPFSGVKDIRASVRRADMGGMLNTRELLDAAGVLRAAASSIAYSSGERGGEKTAIDYLFYSLISNKNLENRITSAIISEEEISDNASGELSDIRRHMRLAADKVRQTLNKIITSPAYSKALQEPIITMKNGRYVVPVKADQKTAVPGLVHDISSSGATQFIEPMAVVQINNELRELEVKEKREIERILMELSAEVAGHGEDIISDFETLVSLDLIFAKAKLSSKHNASAPEVTHEMRIKLKNARHPLLQADTVVPVDLRLGDEFDTLVITGPNTGGKTVTLKTLGLLCAMAQCGMHIPAAEESIVPVFDCILADIGDEQSIEQSLSTFSSHMKNIVGILESAMGNSLMLFDELGAGTDPVEGAALAIAVIEHARSKSALIAATTHYSELKIYAMTSPGVSNASCEFDIQTLKPTYRLITGVPGKSNAFTISRRLGLPERVIEDAKGRVNVRNTAFEDALASLEESRITLEGERVEADKALQDAVASRKQAQEYKEQLDNERDKAVKNAKREAAQILEETRKTAESVMEELRLMQRKAASGVDWQKQNEEKTELLRRLNEAADMIEDEVSDDVSTALSREIIPGDKVKLRKLGTFADVVSVSHDGVLSLQAGIMKVTARADEVILVDNETPTEIKKHLAKSDAKLRELTAKPEIDLRGMAADEAIPVFERFLDSARQAKLNSVTVIHGKGGGVLRQAVHQNLRREQRGIKSFRLGRYGEGEDGVTIVEFLY